MSEFVPENDFIMGKNVKEAPYTAYGNFGAVPPPPPPPLNAEKKKKKKSGAFGIFKAALYVLRKKPDEKEAKKAAEKQKSKDSNGGNWKMLVESMRPLHVPETPQSPMHPRMSPAVDDYSFIAPPSPAASSSCGTLSQYASAASLRDLYNSDDEEDGGDPDEVFDAITGDEMIDAKAEEFIAQFYKSIQLQNSIHHQEQDTGF